jgi:hypothetical protein
MSDIEHNRGVDGGAGDKNDDTLWHIFHQRRMCPLKYLLAISQE